MYRLLPNQKGPVLGPDEIVMVGCLGPYTQGSEGDIVSVACGYSAALCNGTDATMSAPFDWVYEQPNVALCHAGKWELTVVPNPCTPQWDAQWGDDWSWSSGGGGYGNPPFDDVLFPYAHGWWATVTYSGFPNPNGSGCLSGRQWMFTEMTEEDRERGNSHMVEVRGQYLIWRAKGPKL